MNARDRDRLRRAHRLELDAMRTGDRRKRKRAGRLRRQVMRLHWREFAEAFTVSAAAFAAACERAEREVAALGARIAAHNGEDFAATVAKLDGLRGNTARLIVRDEL